MNALRAVNVVLGAVVLAQFRFAALGWQTPRGAALTVLAGLAAALWLAALWRCFIADLPLDRRVG